MGILSGNPKDEPLHYGEVFTVWTTLLTNRGKIAGYQTFYNHAGDDDLKKLIEDAVQLLKDEEKILEKILKFNVIFLLNKRRCKNERRNKCCDRWQGSCRICSCKRAC